jgi:hypothetical protein
MKFVAAFLISSTILLADTSPSNDISLDLRAVYVNYSFDRYWKDSEAFISSIKLGYTHHITDNLEVKVAFGAIEDFGLNNPDKQSMTYIYNRNGNTFALLNQAYLKYTVNKNYIQAGRFEFSSPLIDSDDYYVLSNSFEGVKSNIQLNNLNLQLGHISRMSGSWDGSYDGGSFVSMNKSAWIHKADNQELSQWPNAVVDFGIKDSGVSYAGFNYADDHFNLKLWDYYGHNFVNAFYTQGDMKYDPLTFSFQYIKFNEIGQMKDVADPRAVIDYSVWGAKIATEINDVKLSMAYTGVSDDASSHLWGTWGGYPYFASGMMVSYFETSLRDAHIYALNSDFSLIEKLSTTLHAGYYDLNKKYTIDTRGNRNAPNGENYMVTYGISNTYKYSDRFSFVLMLAGRTLENGDKGTYVRTILKYAF